MTDLLVDNTGVTVYAPGLPRTFEPTRPSWSLPSGKKLGVSLLLHSPAYRDNVPEGLHSPLAMQGGVGRDTAEPRHGQVARLSQWDFGLSVGIFRLLDIAERSGVPAAVALDEYGVLHAPGLAVEIGKRAQEVVARGQAANVITGEGTPAEQERAMIRRVHDVVMHRTGREVSGWFSPERATSSRTPELLSEAGLRWFGEWPVDEQPVALEAANGRRLVSLPFALDTEDMFSLYARGMEFQRFEQSVKDTVNQLVDDAPAGGARYLGLSWFGWVLGQACFAGVAESILGWLAGHPEVEFLLPHEAAELATGEDAE